MPGYSDPGFDTLSLHAGTQPDPATGARAVPIHLTTSFVFESSDHAASLFNLERPGHVYSRISNPTNAVLEQRVSALEGGVGAIAVSSGQAALHLSIATLMGAGSHIVASTALYGGSFDWEKSGKVPELTEAYDGFHNMVFSEESTVGAFLLRARREGLRDFGACMSPHTAWLILQGIETLPLRMERHMRNTEKVVQFLASHPLVSRVGHPMLETHSSHALAKKLLPRGAGSVFSFDLTGSREQGKAFVESLKVFSHLANVGDCRSLVIHPASTTHFRMSDEALAGAGITQGTIRLSIGLEDPDDLIDDLKRALKVAEKAGA